MSTTLPTTRDLLTSLISSLPNIPIQDNATTSTTNTNQSHKSSTQPTNPDSLSNPLRLILQAYRPLLTTLHVLYPSTLLPALDLLDRHLVTRVVLKQDLPQHTSPIKADTSKTPSRKEDNKSTPLYHLVSSAQPQSHRHHHHHSATTPGQIYIVRLLSWNCTCAAFAFSAFPPPSRSHGQGHGYAVQASDTPQQENTSGESWEFGGLSKDGQDGVGGVPCCKHLLACVLAEKWNAVLGQYIEERVVGREEGAGLVGDL
ncbi:hypothetical protein GGS21DRAFT_159709 [Xylaria nigripes]|nr:hypothetical protein GGS21DRAFT_159709 [Xylaria nigripes]